MLNFYLDFVLKDGDVVKLDLGVHVDGYIAVVAHTVILSEAKKSRAADALLAAHYCAEAALRLVKPGNEVNQQKFFLKLWTKPIFMRHFLVGYFIGFENPSYDIYIMYLIGCFQCIFLESGEISPKVFLFFGTIFPDHLNN